MWLFSVSRYTYIFALLIRHKLLWKTRINFIIILWINLIILNNLQEIKLTVKYNLIYPFSYYLNTNSRKNKQCASSLIPNLNIPTVVSHKHVLALAASVYRISKKALKIKAENDYIFTDTVIFRNFQITKRFASI